MYEPTQIERDIGDVYALANADTIDPTAPETKELFARIATRLSELHLPLRIGETDIAQLEHDIDALLEDYRQTIGPLATAKPAADTSWSDRAALALTHLRAITSEFRRLHITKHT